jgi:hypothetical protein
LAAWQSLVALEIVETAPQITGHAERFAEVASRQIAVAQLSFVAPRFVHEGCGHRCEPGRIQCVPIAEAKSLGDEKVALSVDAAQHPARWRKRNYTVLGSLEVAQDSQHVGYSIEHFRDGACSTPYFGSQLVGLSLEFPPPLPPPRVIFAIRARVARVLFLLASERSESVLSFLALSPALDDCAPSSLSLEVAELSPNRGVFGEVPQVAGHGFCIARERGLLLAHLLGEVNNGTVCLKLRERRFEDVARAITPKQLDEIDSHIVGRLET